MAIPPFPTTFPQSRCFPHQGKWFSRAKQVESGLGKQAMEKKALSQSHEGAFADPWKHYLDLASYKMMIGIINDDAPSRWREGGRMHGGGYLRRYPISLLAFINLDVTGWFVPHRESADPFQAFFRCRVQELCPRHFLLTQSLAWQGYAQTVTQIGIIAHSHSARIRSP